MGRRIGLLVLGVVCLCLETTQVIGSPLSGYIGCFNEKASAREFDYPASRHGLGEMEPVLCRKTCGLLGFMYGALHQGQACFCANSYGLYGSTSNVNCSIPCPGNSLTECGGMTFISVYRAYSVVTGNVIAKAPGLIKTYTPTVVKYNITRGDNVTFVITVSDGSFPTTTTNNQSITYAFRRPGRTAVCSEATDAAGYVSRDSEVFDVSTPLPSSFVLSCPSSVDSNETFECTAMVASGSNFNFTVNWGDDTAPTVINYGEAEWYTLGYLSQTASGPGGLSATTLHFLFDEIVTAPSVPMGIELNAVGTGSVIVQFYRPSCPTAGTAYCYWAHSCISTSQVCSNQTYWSKQCGDSLYSIARQRCVNTTTGATVTTPPPASFASMSVAQWDFVGEVPVTVTQTGISFFQVAASQQLALLAGDMLVVYAVTANVVGFTTTSATTMFVAADSAVASFASRASVKVTATSSGTSASLNRPHVKVHMARSLAIRLPHLYNTTTLLVANVTMTVANDATNVTLTKVTPIAIFQRVRYFTFSSPVAGESHRTRDAFRHVASSGHT